MTLSKRGGIFTNELVILLLIISIGAALARPRIREARLQSLVSAAVADMDVPQIAEVMGTSAGSAEQLLVRGRRALRQHMASTEQTGDNRQGSMS